MNLPNLPDSVTVTLNVNQVPTEFLLIAERRANGEVRYRGEISFQEDGEVETAVCDVIAGNDTAGRPNVRVISIPHRIDHSIMEIGDKVAARLGIAR